MNVTERLDQLQRDRPWLSLPIAVGKRFSEHQGSRLSAAVAFFTFFSLFPLLLVFVSILDLVLADRPDLRADLLDSAIGRLPLIGSQIETPDSSTGGLVTVGVGLALSLWAGLGATAALTGAFSSIWDVRPSHRPNFVIARLQGLAAVISIALLVVVSTLVGNGAAIVGSNMLTASASLILNVAVNIVGLLVVFFFLTANDDPWRRHVPGAVLGGFAVFALQQLGGAIARRYVENASDTYGTLAVVIGLLVWLHLVTRSVIGAAEINAVVARRLYPRSLDDSVVSDADRRAMLLNTERVLYDEQLSPVVSVPASTSVDW